MVVQLCMTANLQYLKCVLAGIKVMDIRRYYIVNDSNQIGVNNFNRGIPIKDGSVIHEAY